MTEEMDNATIEAMKEFDANKDDWSAVALIKWMEKWYLKAGWKRLGRALVDSTKKKKDMRIPLSVNDLRIPSIPLGTPLRTADFFP